ncbi:MAG: DNRLRE domain-containing protein, partial [Ruminococcaceae bacterium]|nr:DNRLRE domain-containing protein [Oscillospiraceae bacterium]
MKKIFSIISVLLCMTILVQSVPVYGLAEIIASDEAELIVDTPAEETLTKDTESIPYILGEITSERTLDTKVFRMSDGSYTAAVYPVQVHYEENGEMKEIDYRFEEITVDGESFLETKNGPVSVRIPSTISDESEVVFASGEHSISFSLSSIEEIEAETFESAVDEDRLAALSESIGAQLLSDENFEDLYSKAKAEVKTLDVEVESAVEELRGLIMSAPGATTSAKYESVMNGIDLNYSISGTTLKEEIVLNRQASALKTFSFVLDAGTLTPVLNLDNSVSLNNSDGEEQLRIASPFMYDAIGAESTDIDVTLSENSDGTYTYKLAPDKKWVASAARIYPVRIDPPVTDSSFYTVKDTTGAFDTSVGNLSNVGELNYLKVGKRYNAGTGTTQEVQAMLYSPIPEVINSTTNIINAYIYLYGYAGGFSSCPNDMQINAYMITSDWNTSNIIENAPLALGSDDKSDDENTLDYVYYNDAAQTTERYRFEITEAVQQWLDGNESNFGIALRASGLGTAESFARFYDSTYTDTVSYQGNNVSACPRFVYIYGDSKGIEDYWTFTSMEAGRTGLVAVNNYNGNFVSVQDLLSSTGNNMPVSLSLYYSLNSRASGTGLGAWRTNYHMVVEECDLVFEIPGVEKVTYKYCYIDNDGTRHYLQQKGEEHLDEDGLEITLTLITGDTNYKYKIETKDHSVYKFDHFGRLSLITDSNGNYNAVRYVSYSDSTDYRISQILEGTDGSATRPTVFEYRDDGDIKITIPEGSYVVLDYISATNKTLMGIVFEDGKMTSIETSQVGAGYFPTKISDGNGHETKITYNSASKQVMELSWGTSTVTMQKYSFEYMHNATTVTDIEGRKSTMQFNGNGHTVGIVDHTSSVGQSYKFGSADILGGVKGTENKLLLTSKTVYASENRMADGNFNIQSDIDNYTVYPATDSVSVSYSWLEGNTGNGVMQITKAQSCTSSEFIYQSVSGLRTGKYTLSAYVSTYGNTLAGGGIQLMTNVFNSDGYRTDTASTKVTTTKQGEWVRLQTTVIIESGDTRINAGISFPADTYGTVYIDDIQLEHNLSGGAGSFNQLENASFIGGVSGWGGSATGTFTAGSIPASADKPAGIYRAATVTGDPSTGKSLRQIVYLDGKEGDVFILGAWAKANSVPVTGEADGKKGRPEFGLHIRFYNGDTPVGETQEVQYNSSIETWQFLTDKVIAPADYTKIYVSFQYNFNTGTASVAAPFLFRESYGQSYVYDEDGNVVSSTDKAETEASFAYKDDTLTSSLSPTGTRYMYAKSDTTQNTTYAVSNSGQRIGFVYNGSGDATQMF